MILERLLAAKREQLAREALAVPECTLFAAAERKRENGRQSGTFREAILREGLSIIAEVKRASPSAGAIAPGMDAAAQAEKYAGGGADAISVLTESAFFQGSADDLETIRVRIPQQPLLRKDFILSERQIAESFLLGADAILLIVAILDAGALRRLVALAGYYGMACLVEAHTADELDTALNMDPEGRSIVLGINHRNLDNGRVDISRFEPLRSLVPAGHSVVAESGVRTPEDARRLRLSGADAILVGEALMRSPNPAALLRAMKETSP